MLEIVKPQNCILAICCPCEYESYLSNRSKEYSYLTNRLRWTIYQKQIAEPLQIVLKRIENLGVKVIKDLTFSELESILSNNNQNKCNAIIIFGNRVEKDSNDFIEFYDGTYSIESIMNIIPTDLKSIIDLCVCVSERMAEKIMTRKDNNIICKYQINKAIPLVWIYFYLKLFEILESNNFSYISGFKEAKREFLH